MGDEDKNEPPQHQAMPGQGEEGGGTLGAPSPERAEDREGGPGSAPGRSPDQGDEARRADAQRLGSIGERDEHTSGPSGLGENRGG